FQAEDGIRDFHVTGVQTCALPISRLRRQWFAKRKGVMALLRETIFQQESPLVDSDAANKASDADAALQELGADQAAFGYVTATEIGRAPCRERGWLTVGVRAVVEL